MTKLKIFTDEHINKAIVEQLRRRGIDVLRCEDKDMKASTNSELLEYATQNGYILLSMDDDVTRLHVEWRNDMGAFSMHQWHNSKDNKELARLFFSA